MTQKLKRTVDPNIFVLLFSTLLYGQISSVLLFKMRKKSKSTLTTVLKNASITLAVFLLNRHFEITHTRKPTTPVTSEHERAFICQRDLKLQEVISTFRFL
jgi:hypothetical protein